MMRPPFRCSLFLLIALLLSGPSFASEEKTADAGPEAGKAPHFFLYASPTTRRLLAMEGVSLKAQVNKWRDLLRARGERYEIVTSPERLAQLPTPGTLILPSAVALTPREREVVIGRLDRGDHLLATASTGIRDHQGLFKGKAFVEHLLPLSSAPGNSAETEFVITAGSSPLTYVLPAGTRLWVDQKSRAWMPAIVGTNDAYLANWARQGENGAMLHATIGNSRRVLIGWPETAWAAHPDEFSRIAELALDWVSDHPVAYVASWPRPYRAAMTLGVDATWRFENMAALATLLTRHRLGATFNFLAADAGRETVLIRNLLTGGHGIGTLGDRWQVFGGETEAAQEKRLADLRTSFAAEVIGLRAPEGRTDAATERAARKFAYLVDAGRVDSILPLPENSDRPFILPNPLNLEEKANAAETFAALRDQAAKLSRLGGYAYVGIDAAAASPGSSMWHGIVSFLDAGDARRDIWITDAASIVRWQRDAQRVSLDSKTDGRGLLLTIRIKEGPPLPDGMSIVVHPPGGQRIVQADGLRLESPQSAGEKTATIAISGLLPGEHHLHVELAP